MADEPAGIAVTDPDRLETQGAVAHEEADVVAHNIAVDITGKGTPARLRLHTI